MPDCPARRKGSSMAKIIVASVPLYGHVTPMSAIAADLVRRGHEVTFLTGSRFCGLIEATGAIHVPLRGVADLDYTRVDEIYPELATIPPGPQLLAAELRHL